MKDPSDWNLSTVGGIPFSLLTRKGSTSYENAEATEEYLIEANRLLDFIQEGFPEATMFGGMFIYPLQPYMGGLSTMVVNKIDWEEFPPGAKPADPFGSDPDADPGTYTNYIKVAVHFGPRPANNAEQDASNPGTFLEVSSDGGGGFLTPPMTTNAFWDAANAAAGGVEMRDQNLPYAIAEPEVQWSVRWPVIPYEFWSGTLRTRLRNSLGRVNSTPLGLIHSSPVDTILFAGYSTRQQATWREGLAGQLPIELSMTFVERNFLNDNVGAAGIPGRVTHQHVRSQAGLYRRLFINGNPLFGNVDLNQIWSPSP